ncbi:hypothetical protein EC988_000571 [Linderina pennispora]|nr:hypothetical protein EC988_000571 [Linderina pennispora]
MATLGVGATGALLTAVAIAHRRAAKTARIAGDDMTANVAMKAFGLGTLYAFSVVGFGTALGNYYLKSTEVQSTTLFSERMRNGMKQMLGASMKERMGISDKDEEEELRRMDDKLFERDEVTGKPKIRFARIKSMVGSDDAAEADAAGPAKKRMSLGARMRAALGYGKKPKEEPAGDSTDARPEQQ